MKTSNIKNVILFLKPQEQELKNHLNSISTNFSFFKGNGIILSIQNSFGFTNCYILTFFPYPPPPS